MKKLIIPFVILVFMISGCKSGEANRVSDANLKVYQDLKEKILTNNGTLSYNIPFSYRIEVDALKGNQYSYTLIIDKALVSMENIQVMALIPSQVSGEKMEPTVGIFDEISFSMIPNQVDVKKGYPKGIALNGVSNDKDFKVFVLVSWHDNKFNKDERVFFSFNIVDGKHEDGVDEYE